MRWMMRVHAMMQRWCACARGSERRALCRAYARGIPEAARYDAPRGCAARACQSVEACSAKDGTCRRCRALRVRCAAAWWGSWDEFTWYAWYWCSCRSTRSRLPVLWRWCWLSLLCWLSPCLMPWRYAMSPVPCSQRYAVLSVWFFRRWCPWWCSLRCFIIRDDDMIDFMFVLIFIPTIFDDVVYAPRRLSDARACRYAPSFDVYVYDDWYAMLHAFTIDMRALLSRADYVEMLDVLMPLQDAPAWCWCCACAARSRAYSSLLPLRIRTPATRSSRSSSFPDDMMMRPRYSCRDVDAHAYRVFVQDVFAIACFLECPAHAVANMRLSARCYLLRRRRAFCLMRGAPARLTTLSMPRFAAPTWVRMRDDFFLLIWPLIQQPSASHDMSPQPDARLIDTPAEPRVVFARIRGVPARAFKI